MYNILCQCFEGLSISRQLYEKALGGKKNVLLTEYYENRAAGFSVVQGEAILMLCVLPEYRGKGIGSQLLSQSEAYIASHGGRTATLGCGETYLFQGVPVAYGAVPFFEKHGYTADWVSADLTMPLGSYVTPSIPACPPDVRFGMLQAGFRKDLPAAVNAVDPDWTSYFMMPDAPVFAALQGGALAGFLLLNEHADTPFFPQNVRGGTIGCVGVLPGYRKRGTGLRMVDAATRELAIRGVSWAHIGYTHLAHWYGKLGYKVCMEFWMGKKALMV